MDNWNVLTGKGSHGSMPELSIDPVVADAVGDGIANHCRAIFRLKNHIVSVGAFPGQCWQRYWSHRSCHAAFIQVIWTLKYVCMYLTAFVGVNQVAGRELCCTYEIHEGQPGAVLKRPEATQYAVEIARRTFGEEER